MLVSIARKCAVNVKQLFYLSKKKRPGLLASQDFEKWVKSCLTFQEQSNQQQVNLIGVTRVNMVDVR